MVCGVEEVDFVSYANLYGGPPISLLKKIPRGLHHLMCDRRQIHQEGNVKHIIIRRLKLPQFLQNLLGDLWAYANLPKWLKNNHYDFCLYSHPHNVFLVSLLKRFKAVEKVFYDDCDFFPDHLDARDPLSSMVLSWKERLAVTKADGVISVTEPLARLRKSQGARNIIVVPNGVVLDHFLEVRQKEPHRPTLVYIGLLSEAWGVDLILKALPLIRREIPDVRFIIVGSGEYRCELESLSTRLGLQEVVTFFGKQPYSELSKYTRQADVGVATYKARRFIEYASPLKIREYMAAGLPVIASKIGEAEKIIKSSGAGELVDNSPTSIASAAIKILSDQKLCEEYSENAIRYAANLDWGTVLEPTLGFIVSA